jgi:N-acetylglucosaminyl-diphospho-decaprenol L-rhamnosyltransferase
MSIHHADDPAETHHTWSDPGDRAPSPLSVSVVVTHYRQPEQLLSCIAAIHRQTVRPEEVFVVDSAALPLTETRLAAAYPTVRYKGFADNVGFAKLVNYGLLATAGEAILVLNADTELAPDAVQHLVDALSDSRVGIAAPTLLNPDGTVQPSAFAFYSPLTVLARRTAYGRSRRGALELSRFGLQERRAREGGQPERVPVGWALGAALLVRRDALADVGLMDEGFFMYFEDVDWCLRSWQAGWSVVWAPKAACMHIHGGASRKSGDRRAINRYAAVHARSGARYFRKHGIRPAQFGQSCDT